MTRHRILPSRRTVHGYFSRDLEPILTIDSGDTIVLTTLDAGWHAPPDRISGEWDWQKHIDWYEPSTDTGHALNGPVAVRGAEPRMTLEIEIGNIRTGTVGWTVAGGWSSLLNDRLGVSKEPVYGITWVLDHQSATARSQEGHVVQMRPFLGVMGMPPDESGVLPTAPPRHCGGNIDCAELVTGTRLFLPVAVPGALFSAGDGHAAQGDGEVSGVAIESPLDEAELTLMVHPDMHITTPRAWTPEAWLTFGFHEDLDEAMITAVNAMLDLMAETHRLDRKEALALASLVVDLRITQVVNGVRGVHAVLRHGLIEEADSVAGS